MSLPNLLKSTFLSKIDNFDPLWVIEKGIWGIVEGNVSVLADADAGECCGGSSRITEHSDRHENETREQNRASSSDANGEGSCGFPTRAEGFEWSDP